MRVAILGLVATLALAGCGGQSIEDAVKEETGATFVICTEAGWMLFVGERETVYECEEEPPPDAVLGPVGEPLGCFVFIDGRAEDVSLDVSDEFTCV